MSKLTLKVAKTQDTKPSHLIEDAKAIQQMVNEMAKTQSNLLADVTDTAVKLSDLSQKDSELEKGVKSNKTKITSVDKSLTFIAGKLEEEVDSREELSDVMHRNVANLKQQLKGVEEKITAYQDTTAAAILTINRKLEAIPAARDGIFTRIWKWIKSLFF